MDDFYIDKVLNGDKDAFRYFIREYKDIAFNLAISIVKDPHITEEVIQDAFIKAYNGLGGFKGRSRFSTWLYRIVVNEAYGYVRKNKNNISLDQIDSKASILIAEDCVENPKMILVRKALRIMDTKEALVLNLFYLEEKSIKEIKSITGWSISNTKVILHRARKNLKKLLNENTLKSIVR